MKARAEAVLRRARMTPGFLPEEEAMALAAAARRAAASGAPLLEIGAYLGRSTLFLAAGLIAAGSAGPGGATSVLYSVDHHHGSAEMQAGWAYHDPTLVDPRSGQMDSLRRWRDTVVAAGVEDVVVGVVGESATIARNWSTPLALVFIDGGHGEDVVAADYEGWSRHVAPGGLLLFHDVFADPADGGQAPYRCYREALATGGYVEDVAAGSGSLRVLRRSGGPKTAREAPPAR